MNWNNRIKIDPNENRKSMMPIVVVMVIAIAALCLGVYFGLFVAMKIFGGG